MDDRPSWPCGLQASGCISHIRQKRLRMGEQVAFLAGQHVGQFGRDRLERPAIARPIAPDRAGRPFRDMRREGEPEFACLVRDPGRDVILYRCSGSWISAVSLAMFTATARASFSRALAICKSDSSQGRSTRPTSSRMAALIALCCGFRRMTSTRKSLSIVALLGGDRHYQRAVNICCPVTSATGRSAPVPPLPLAFADKATHPRVS